MSISRRIWTLGIIPLAALALMAPARPDFARKPGFRIELDGVSLGSWSKVSGLEVRIEVLEFREGSDPNAIPRKLPGRTTFANVTLERGYVNQSFFEAWIGQVREGAPGFRKNLSLVILDRSGAEAARYNLFNCWPASWELKTPDGKGGDVVMEEVVLAVEGFEKV